jgi:calcineurin-like phosphoesterase family protein
MAFDKSEIADKISDVAFYRGNIVSKRRQLEDNSWVFTDPHFNHPKLVERGNRPLGYEGLVQASWIELVQPTDFVYCLGDVCMKKPGDSHDQYVRPMPGRKILIRGNHDDQSDTWYLAHGWDEVYDTLLVEHHSRRVLLSHIPKPDNNSYDINVHGHFHNDAHRANSPEMLAIKSPKHRLLALECVDYKLIPFPDFIEGRIEQKGLPS